MQGCAMRRSVLVMSFLFSIAGAISADDALFVGLPLLRVSEGGTSRSTEALQLSEAKKWTCSIEERRGNYFWTSREDKPLSRHRSGAFLTFAAIDGSGYVRMIDPSMLHDLPSLEPAETRFEYVEHLLLGLSSVTYYGKMLPQPGK